MPESSGSAAPPPQLLETIRNLAEFHREHEKFYAQAPLRKAVEIQAASRVLKALADHWREGEPAEIKQLRRDLETAAKDLDRTSAWLSAAMEQSWQIAGALADYAALADLLGERHRIIANDWQSADLQALVSRLLRRSLDLIARIDFSPEALRADLAGERRNVASYRRWMSGRRPVAWNRCIRSRACRLPCRRWGWRTGRSCPKNASTCSRTRHT